MRYYNLLSKSLILSTTLLFFTLSYIDCRPAHDSSLDGTTVVGKNGLLKASGNLIVNKNGEPTVIKGMSLFWSQWKGDYYNYECIKWLRDDWNCSVIRIAMATGEEGYRGNPEKELKKAFTVIEACIDLGIYVIMDWHSHNAQSETKLAVAFFREIATKYGNTPNLIYEIYNEPLRISWSDEVKPYCDTVIAAIREIDNDNLIIVGTPSWSQDVDIAANNPIVDSNVAYAVHFYAGTHKQWLRDKVDIALNKGLAIFVSEFGTCNSNGNGNIDYEETKLWIDYMKKNKLSWCNWSVADKDETSSILKKGASIKGNWKPNDISESGKLIKQELKK